MHSIPVIRSGTVILSWVILLSPTFAQPKAVPKTVEVKLTDEMKKLQGTWQVTKFIESSEKPAPPAEVEEMTFEFKDDQLRISKVKNVRGSEPFKFALDPTKSLKAIDIYFLGEPNNPSQGIYKLDGDELTICLSGAVRNGKAPPRPAEFKASKRDFYVLFVMKKVMK